jgi:hypothetical protein
MTVIYAIHRRLVGLTNNVRYYLLTAPNHALHRCTLGQLYEAADNILEERRRTTHGAKKSPVGEVIVLRCLWRRMRMACGTFIFCPLSWG